MAGRGFTDEERRRLESLDAVERVDGAQITYSEAFRAEALERWHAGEGPAEIFAAAGMPRELVGPKRPERALARWRAAEGRGGAPGESYAQARQRVHGEVLAEKQRALTEMALRCEARVAAERERSAGLLARETSALRASAAAEAAELKRAKIDAVERQRGIRAREAERWERRLAKQKQRSRRREERLIASQRAEIKSLRAQVRALKASCSLARSRGREPGALTKSERFAVVAGLREADPSYNVSAGCRALGVSRRGYYDWLAAAPAREAREAADEAAHALVQEARAEFGFEKGSRQVCDRLRRRGEPMNRKKVLRLQRKYGTTLKPRRRRPYRRVGADGEPRVAPNSVDRAFRAGEAYRVIGTDITYLPSAEGFCYLSAVQDYETNEVLSHVASPHLDVARLVLPTLAGLSGLPLAGRAVACSDQGVHYTSAAYRRALASLGVAQSMSRRACCWDNAPIESFWGRLKEQVGDTSGKTCGEIAALVDAYVDYYNNGRGQERLGWMTPVEYRESITA